MSEETKNEELQEEVEATDVVTEEETKEQPQEEAQNEELQKALERAEDFENKYLRAHAEMQNIQRRANEERQQLQKYRSQDLAKAILPSLDNLERALAVEGLTDDVKKGRQPPEGEATGVQGPGVFPRLSDASVRCRPAHRQNNG